MTIQTLDGFQMTGAVLKAAGKRILDLKKELEGEQRVNRAAADELQAARRNVKLLKFGIKARDSVAMDLMHDHALTIEEASEAYIAQLRQKERIWLDFRQYKHNTKLRFRAFADMARQAVYGDQSLPSKVTTLKALVEQLDVIWRNV
jgi:hypothetical protein